MNIKDILSPVLFSTHQKRLRPDGHEIAPGEIIVTDQRVITITTPSLGLGCFIRKPVSIDYLIKRIRSELD